jgi:hypothetical protein
MLAPDAGHQSETARLAGAPVLGAASRDDRPIIREHARFRR